MSTAMEEAPSMMMQMMSMFQMMMMQQQGMSADSLGLEVFANKRPKKAPKAIMDKPAEEPGDNDAAEGKELPQAVRRLLRLDRVLPENTRERTEYTACASKAALCDVP